jgi:glycosyltransferase involved in cell wall biosynthesis
VKVAIVHYWFVGMRGGEKVIEALCDLYPEADIYTHVYVPSAVSETIRRHRVTTTFINSLPRSPRMYKSYLPLMPLALEQLDLRGYDLVISSESGPAKGVIASPEALHVCYCHTPMRYIWNMYHDYRSGAGRLTRLIMPPISHYLRMWDVSTAARVDSFIANSATVAARIERYYRRDAVVIHPPVDTKAFAPVSSSELDDYYLMAGELVAYKRPELAVRAFNETGRRLVIIGGGEMLEELKRIAGPNISILGSQPFEVLKHHYARCRALIFPGEEDFGMVPVEAMASGRPVIAFRKGGATETVLPNVTGVFFDTQDVDAIRRALEDIERMEINPADIAAHAGRFGKEQFYISIRKHIEDQIAKKSANGIESAFHAVRRIDRAS